jgi:hypothetical protein
MNLQTRILILISFIVCVAGRVTRGPEDEPRAYEPPSKLDYEKIKPPLPPPPAPRRGDEGLIQELNKTKLDFLENNLTDTSGVWSVNQTTNVTDFPERPEDQEKISGYWSADDDFERSSAELMGLLFPIVSLLLNKV